MSALVTGTFEAENQAVNAVRKLLNSCVPSHCVRTIFPGSRKRLAELRSQGVNGAGEPGGIMVAVRASDHVSQRLALKVLRDHGARDIENVKARRRAAQAQPRRTLDAIQYPLPL